MTRTITTEPTDFQQGRGVVPEIKGAPHYFEVRLSFYRKWRLYKEFG